MFFFHTLTLKIEQSLRPGHSRPPMSKKLLSILGVMLFLAGSNSHAKFIDPLCSFLLEVSTEIVQVSNVALRRHLPPQILGLAPHLINYYHLPGGVQTFEKSFALPLLQEWWAQFPQANYVGHPVTAELLHHYGVTERVTGQVIDQGDGFVKILDQKGQVHLLALEGSMGINLIPWTEFNSFDNPDIFIDFFPSWRDLPGQYVVIETKGRERLVAKFVEESGEYVRFDGTMPNVFPIRFEPLPVLREVMPKNEIYRLSPYVDMHVLDAASSLLLRGQWYQNPQHRSYRHQVVRAWSYAMVENSTRARSSSATIPQGLIVEPWDNAHLSILRGPVLRPKIPVQYAEGIVIKEGPSRLTIKTLTGHEVTLNGAGGIWISPTGKVFQPRD
jgi:hypothetical protein